MARWLMVLFGLLTLATAWSSWNNVGVEKTTFTQQKSVRTGSPGGVYGGYSGGYRTGK